MNARKQRPRWYELPVRVRQQIEYLVGAPVVAVHNCPGGYSPGFASRLTLAGGQKAFAKAIDGRAWPFEARTYRNEAENAAGLTAAGLANVLPTPRLLGSCEVDSHVVLAFECIDGSEPSSPWRPDELTVVAAAISRMSALLTPSPLTVPDDHPRLAGWAELKAGNEARLRALPQWVARHLTELIALERRGLVAAQGTALVHFDALPHNILLTPAGVVLADWPHARLGAPAIDLLTVLASAAADGIDPEPVLRAQPIAATVSAADTDAILAALSGFSLAGALNDACPAAIAAAKLHLGRGALGWLRRRLGAISTAFTSTVSWHQSC